MSLSCSTVLFSPAGLYCMWPLSVLSVSLLGPSLLAFNATLSLPALCLLLPCVFAAETSYSFTMYIPTLSALAVLSSVCSGASIPRSGGSGRHLPRQDIEAGPLISSNFPDPSYMEANGVYYAFGTNNGAQHVPVATSSDFQTWTIADGVDALPTAGSWSDGNNVWAPDVSQLVSWPPSFSARLISAPGRWHVHHVLLGRSRRKHGIPLHRRGDGDGARGPVHADERHAAGVPDRVSRARGGGSTGPRGGVTARRQGGAIDAAGFQDYDGTLYVVYKVDGNALYPGGTCGNPDNTAGVTPILLQQLDGTGANPVGAAVTVLSNGPYDGPRVEAPSLSRIADPSAAGGWMYILFFSSALRPPPIPRFPSSTTTGRRS